MNVTDLRIAFKIDTGSYPLWAKTHDGRDMEGTSFLKGHPRTIYGLWLEDKIGKFKYLRDRYYQVTKEAPTKYYFGTYATYTYTFLSRGFSKYRGTHNPQDVLHGEYIEWLETFILKFKPELV